MRLFSASKLPGDAVSGAIDRQGKVMVLPVRFFAGASQGGEDDALEVRSV